MQYRIKLGAATAAVLLTIAQLAAAAPLQTVNESLPTGVAVSRPTTTVTPLERAQMIPAEAVIQPRAEKTGTTITVTGADFTAIYGYDETIHRRADRTVTPLERVTMIPANAINPRAGPSTTTVISLERVTMIPAEAIINARADRTVIPLDRVQNIPTEAIINARADRTMTPLNRVQNIPVGAIIDARSDKTMTPLNRVQNIPAEAIINPRAAEETYSASPTLENVSPDGEDAAGEVGKKDESAGGCKGELNLIDVWARMLSGMSCWTLQTCWC